jgi:hypothetical protein
MARNCNCAGSTCGCLVTAGNGITVTGTGTAADPFIIVNSAANLAQALTVTDTVTLDMVKTGSGTNLDPIIISGNVTLKMQQLSDVQNPGGVPLAGQIPVYVGTSGTDGHWEFRAAAPAFTTAARPAVASVPIGYMYFDTTVGKPVWKATATLYKDAAGVTI